MRIPVSDGHSVFVSSPRAVANGKGAVTIVVYLFGSERTLQGKETIVDNIRRDREWTTSTTLFPHHIEYYRINRLYHNLLILYTFREFPFPPPCPLATFHLTLTQATARRP